MNWFRWKVARAAVVLMLGLSVVTLTTLPAQTAFADSKTEKKLQKALAAAVEDYDMLEIDGAEKKLKDAIKLAEKNDVKGATVARLYMMLGVVQFAASRDEKATEESFVAALNQDGNAQIEPVYVTPELEKIYETAKGKAKPPANAVTQLQHEQIATTDAGKPMKVVVDVPANMPVYKIFVLYKRFDAESFDRVELEPTSNTQFAANVPAAEIRSSQIDYFILAEDRGGNIIGQIGSDEAPLNVVVLGSSDLPDGQVKKDDKKDDPDPDPDPGSGEHKWVYVSIFGGTGGGLIIGGAPTANPESEISPGTAPAFAHVLLDFGVRITDAAHLGIFFRYQFAPSQDFSNISTESGISGTEECLGLGLSGDCILGLKYKWFFKTGPGVKVYSSTGMGMGRVRNWLEIKQPATSQQCQGKEILAGDGGGDYCLVRDTVRAGWLHAGVGGGLGVPITDWMDFVADAYLMFLFPDTAINIDLNAGFSFSF